MFSFYWAFVLLGIIKSEMISGPDWVLPCDFFFTCNVSKLVESETSDQMEKETLMEEGSRPGVLVVGSSGVGKRTLLSRTCFFLLDSISV